MTDGPTVVRIERRGGLAGLPARAVVTLTDLPEGQRLELEALLASKGKPRAGRGADRFSYHLSRADSDSGGDLVLSEDETPRWLARLVRTAIPGIDS